jgi:hypothetical protein
MSWRACAPNIHLDTGPDAGGPLTRGQAVAVINQFDWRCWPDHGVLFCREVPAGRVVTGRRKP